MSVDGGADKFWGNRSRDKLGDREIEGIIR